MVDMSRRMHALAAGVTNLEIALTACQVSRRGREGIQERLKRAPKELHFPADLMPPDIGDAVRARHAAIHELDVPSPSACVRFVGVLHVAWAVLRRQFVTRESAAKVAERILQQGAAREVLLFGS